MPELFIYLLLPILYIHLAKFTMTPLVRLTRSRGSIPALPLGLPEHAAPSPHPATCSLHGPRPGVEACLVLQTPLTLPQVPEEAKGRKLAFVSNNYLC